VQHVVMSTPASVAENALSSDADDPLVSFLTVLRVADGSEASLDVLFAELGVALKFKCSVAVAAIMAKLKTPPSGLTAKFLMQKKLREALLSQRNDEVVSVATIFAFNFRHDVDMSV
jgi:hypothetical protein